MLKRRHRWMANARLPFQKGNPDAGRIRAMCGMCECKKSRFRAFAPQRGFGGVTGASGGQGLCPCTLLKGRSPLRIP